MTHLADRVALAIYRAACAVHYEHCTTRRVRVAQYLTWGGLALLWFCYGWTWIR